MKVAVLCNAGSASFIDPVIKALGAKHEARHFPIETERDVIEGVTWADVVWCEWATELAVYLSRNPSKPLVVRLHRYEVWEPAMKAINWGKVDALVVTNHEAWRNAVAANKKIADVRTFFIPSLIDLDEWTFKAHEGGLNIGVVGYIEARKNPFAWLQLLASLNEKYDLPRKLHIAGEFREPYIKAHFEDAIRNLGLAASVTFYGQLSHPDLNTFWQGMDYCLSASVHEGCPYNVLEAMACGVIPVVHAYPGARDHFDPSMLWASLAQAETRMSLYLDPFIASQSVRDMVEERFSIQVRGKELIKVVEAACGLVCS